MYTQDIYYGQGQLYLQIHIPLFPTNDVSPTNIQIVELPHETDSSIMPNTAHVQKKKKKCTAMQIHSLPESDSSHKVQLQM